jgi:hypothetical protein
MRDLYLLVCTVHPRENDDTTRSLNTDHFTQTKDNKPVKFTQLFDKKPISKRQRDRKEEVRQKCQDVGSHDQDTRWFGTLRLTILTYIYCQVASRPARGHVVELENGVKIIFLVFVLALCTFVLVSVNGIEAKILIPLHVSDFHCCLAAGVVVQISQTAIFDLRGKGHYDCYLSIW